MTEKRELVWHTSKSTGKFPKKDLSEPLSFSEIAQIFVKLYTSLLCALNALTLVSRALLIGVLVALLTTGGLRVALRLIVFLKHTRLAGIAHVLIRLLLHRESLCDLRQVLLGDRSGERHLENDVEVAGLVRCLMERQTFFRHTLDFIWLDHLARFVLNPKCAAIQVLDGEVDTGHCLQECDLLLKHDVGTFALEKLVRLLLANNDHVACLDTGVLVCLAVVGVLSTVGRTLINADLENFLLFYYFFAIAIFALILLVDDFTFASAVLARSLLLAVHARAQLNHSNDHATTLAS